MSGETIMEENEADRRSVMRRLSTILPSPWSTLLDASGIFRSNSDESAGLRDSSSIESREDEEVSIRIIGETEHESTDESTTATTTTITAASVEEMTDPTAGTTTPGRESVAQRYDFQQLAKWIEQVLPFTILLLVVFIRQHLQGFLVTIWMSALLVKSNDILRKQTSLRGERKTYILLGLSSGLLAHVIGIYWWYQSQSLWRPLMLLPPPHIPKFSDAIFNIVLNDTMVRISAMLIKCAVLIYYKKGRGRNYRWQAQLLTLTEYVSLLYRTVIPASVWYRFFLNQEYGNLFSSLTTGLYLTFKVTSIFDKVQKFVVAVRSVFRREVQYGSYATSEEVLAAGDLCAICQEKMHAPISLRCKHVFCEDCVSEWFERERTCPLCRSVVKSSNLRSFGDGSTSLFVQLF